MEAHTSWTDYFILITKKLISWRLVLILILIITTSFGTYFIFKNQNFLAKTHDIYNNTDTQQELKDKAEVRETLDELSNIMMLPNETPTVATVLDSSKLSNDSFFKSAENGDRVIIYNDAQKAVLYRPSLKKIINVIAPQVMYDTHPSASAQTLGTAPADSPVQDTSPSPSAQSKKRDESVSGNIKIFNGSNRSGLALSTQKKLEAYFPKAKFLVGGDTKKDYDTTLVISQNTKFTQQAKTIAEFLNGKVDKMPSGESLKEGDIIVIITAP